jgi:hypothetical protein
MRGLRAALLGGSAALDAVGGLVVVVMSTEGSAHEHTTAVKSLLD